MLLPLNPQWLLCEAPKKLAKVKKMVDTAAIAKETGSRKLRFGADVLPFAVSPMILIDY